MLFAEHQRLVPCRFRVGDEAGILDRSVIEWNRIDAQAFIALCFAVSGAAMVADDAEHVLRVVFVAGERAKLACHFGRRRIGHARHDRGECAANRAAFVRVIRNAVGHQQAANIGET